MDAAQISGFLTDLAVRGHVAASTQNQALNALVFLYTQVVGLELGRLDAVRARRPKYLPCVLAPEQIKRILDAIEGGEGVFRLMASVLFQGTARSAATAGDCRTGCGRIPASWPRRSAAPSGAPRRRRSPAAGGSSSRCPPWRCPAVPQASTRQHLVRRRDVAHVVDGVAGRDGFVVLTLDARRQTVVGRIRTAR
jgi:hypothetical protein